MPPHRLPRLPSLEAHLLLGPKSFFDMKHPVVTIWRHVLADENPDLQFHFIIQPDPLRLGSGTRPGVAENYDTFIFHHNTRYRLAIGRWLFTVRGRLTLLAFIYPCSPKPSLDATFGTITVPSTSVVYNAFLEGRAPTPSLPIPNLPYPEIWQPIPRWLRAESLLTFPEFEPVELPTGYKAPYTKVKILSQYWLLAIDEEGIPYLTDTNYEIKAKIEGWERIELMTKERAKEMEWTLRIVSGR